MIHWTHPYLSARARRLPSWVGLGFRLRVRPALVRQEQARWWEQRQASILAEAQKTLTVNRKRYEIRAPAQGKRSWAGSARSDRVGSTPVRFGAALVLPEPRPIFSRSPSRGRA